MHKRRRSDQRLRLRATIGHVQPSRPVSWLKSRLEIVVIMPRSLKGATLRHPHPQTNGNGHSPRLPA